MYTRVYARLYSWQEIPVYHCLPLSEIAPQRYRSLLTRLRGDNVLQCRKSFSLRNSGNLESNRPSRSIRPTVSSQLWKGFRMSIPYPLTIAFTPLHMRAYFFLSALGDFLTGQLFWRCYFDKSIESIKHINISRCIRKWIFYYYNNVKNATCLVQFSWQCSHRIKFIIIVYYCDSHEKRRNHFKDQIIRDKII